MKFTIAFLAIVFLANGIFQLEQNVEDCGLRRDIADQDAKEGEFPWHVAIYYKYKYICGGSIITSKLVLTAAHSFRSKAAHMHIVGAGKYYSAYNDTRDKHAQFSQVKQIIIHKDYKNGIPYEAFDIAVLVLTNPFEMTRYVLPVCLDAPRFNLSKLINKVGIVTGWGFAQDTEEPTETLKYLEVDYKTTNSCHLPKNMLTFYLPNAPDKLCAGVKERGKGVCKSDSGGGLVFQKDSKKYFLRGIISIEAARTFGCSDELTLYTSVDYHIQFIQQLEGACPPFPQENNVIVECDFNSSKIPCDIPFEGTRARVRCAFLHEDPSLISVYNNCINGTWYYPFPNCKPVCGLRRSTAEQMINGNNDAKPGEFPWHVGIFRLTENICGGSIITPKLVLSAAHCFEPNVTEMYSVGAGKYYRSKNDTSDIHAQFSKLNKIILHKYYSGVILAFDLAVLVLANPFEMTRYVLPVCLDVSNYDLSKLVSKVGIVTGWGIIEETGKPAESLKYYKVDYKTAGTCSLYHWLVVYYLPFAPDKLCAGLANQGKSLCKGYSGGGLVFQKDSNKYFIRGIVSVGGSPRQLGCGSGESTLFTSVDYNIRYIEELKNEYRS